MASFGIGLNGANKKAKSEARFRQLVYCFFGLLGFKILGKLWQTRT
jgi:hypothetical protein